MSDIPRTAVNQGSYGGSDYPFTGPTDLEGLVLDAYLSYTDVECAYTLPFVLSTTDADYRVHDANGELILIADTSEITTQVWGDRMVNEWQNEKHVLRLVTQDLSIDVIPPTSAELDPRTCNRLPARVTSLRVGLLSLTDNIILEAGNNIQLSGADNPVLRVEGGRYITTINIDAIPGAGRGKVSGCDEVEPLVRKINNTQPDCGGNFIIETDPCFRGELPLSITGGKGDYRTAVYSEATLVSEEAESALKLESDCLPCCPCDAFVRTYKGLDRVWNRWQAVATTAEGVRDTYEDSRTRWLAARQCQLDNPARLIASTAPKCKTTIGASYCNSTSCCITPVEFRFTFRRYIDGVLTAWSGGGASEAYIDGSATQGEQPYSPLVTGAVVQFFMAYADPQAISVVKMRFCTSDCMENETIVVTLTVHVPQPEPNVHTEDLCTLTDVTDDVDTDIRDIWTGYGIVETPPVRAVLTQAVALNPNRPVFGCGC